MLNQYQNFLSMDYCYSILFIPGYHLLHLTTDILFPLLNIFFRPQITYSCITPSFYSGICSLLSYSAEWYNHTDTFQNK